MAQLKDLIVNGDARIIGKLYANQSLPDGVFHLANISGTAAVTTSPYTAAKWQTTADDPRITSLYSGLTISLKIPVAGNGTYGTLLQVNGLGYHPVVYNVNNYIGTRYSVGSTIHLTYNATQTATAYNNGTSATTYTGCWQMEDFDSTNIYQLRDANAPATVDSDAGALYRYQLCLTNREGHLIPYNNVSNAATTYTKTLNSAPFDPFASTINAGSNAGASALYQHILFDSRYSMNIQSDGTAGTTALTAYKPVYIHAVYNDTTGMATLDPLSSSSNYLDRSSIIQNFSTSEGWTDNDILIYLGRANNNYQIELNVNHPVYKWNSKKSIWELFGSGNSSSGGSVEPASQTTLGGLHVSYNENTRTLYIDNYSDSGNVE